VSSNTERQIASLGDRDILLRPELSDEYTSAAFGEIEHIIPVGYAAAVDSTDSLRVLAVSDGDYSAWRRSVSDCATPTPQLQFVRLENESRFSDEVIFNKLSVKPGDTLDHAQLQNDIAHIYGLGFIRHAQYRVVEENGRSGVVIDVQQDTRGTDFIETGLGLSGDGRGSYLDLRAAYLKTDLTERGAEFRAAIQVGSAFGLETGAYVPLDNNLRWIIKPQVFLSRREMLAFDDGGHPLLSLDIEELGGKFGFGREFGRHAGIFAGVSRYAGKVSVNIGDPAIGSYRFDGSDFTVYGIYDRLDDLYMPSYGSRFTMEYVRSLESLGADQDFEQIRASLFTAHSWDEHTVWVASRFNTTLDDNAPVYALYTGGGFLNMSGYESNELVGQHFGFSMLGYRYRLGEGGLLPAYVGGTLEYGGAAERSKDVYGEGDLTGSFYLGYNSPIGPLYLGYGWNREQSGVVFLRLGSILGGQSIGQR
jgi:NTE family protein